MYLNSITNGGNVAILPTVTAQSAQTYAQGLKAISAYGAIECATPFAAAKVLSVILALFESSSSNQPKSNVAASILRRTLFDR